VNFEVLIGSAFSIIPREIKEKEEAFKDKVKNALSKESA